MRLSESSERLDISTTPVDENTMKLSIKIFSGESTEKYFEKFRRHVGQKQSASDSHTKNQGISTVSDSENSAGQTSKKICDGLEISIREFFDSDLFDDLEQEIQ